MLSYELIFEGCWFINDADEAIKSHDQYRRIIRAANYETAQKIGKAMEGEETWYREYLGSLIKVRETAQSPTSGYWDHGEHTWSRVLARLDLDPNMVELIKHGQVIAGIKGSLPACA
jgi:hypothetical protein